ncbi:hypothetical protein MSG28_009631 [Choristoneura fumiferana]|uniref:Uncharacterized protein n=1 Tax=Choristoneura fumiferana TaxID=7141 RepID=A0ACC0JC24_CHOFU|nr:hypothetical protein MSG28_009631 [Choristoneura fumiferana]
MWVDRKTSLLSAFCQLCAQHPIIVSVNTDIVDKDDYKALEHAMLDRQYMYARSVTIHERLLVEAGCGGADLEPAFLIDRNGIRSGALRKVDASMKLLGPVNCASRQPSDGSGGKVKKLLTSSRSLEPSCFTFYELTRSALAAKTSWARSSAGFSTSSALGEISSAPQIFGAPLSPLGGRHTAPYPNAATGSQLKHCAFNSPTNRHSQDNTYTYNHYKHDESLVSHNAWWERRRLDRWSVPHNAESRVIDAHRHENAAPCQFHYAEAARTPRARVACPSGGNVGTNERPSENVVESGVAGQSAGARGTGEAMLAETVHWSPTRNTVVTFADPNSQPIRNSEIRKRCGLKEHVVTKIEKGVLRWFGHVERMNEERLTKKVYEAKPSVRESDSHLAGFLAFSYLAVHLVYSIS